MGQQSDKSAIVRCQSNEQLANTIDVIKQFRGDSVSPEDVVSSIYLAQKAGFTLGKRVEIMGVGKGKIVDHNRSTGMFNGARYPVIIERDDGHVFEYSVEQLKLI